MLRLDLSEIIRTVGMQQVYDIDEQPYPEEDVVYLAPIRGRATVTNSGFLIHVRGNVSTVIAAECGRCLTDLRVPIDGELSEQFTLKEVASSAYHDVAPSIVQDEENEVPVGLFNGGVMDLAVLIRQAILLNEPITMVCREDCAGLCPHCGKNRNTTTCACGSSDSAKPFAALAELFNDTDTKQD